ncbi:hypothetical protein FQN49_001656 [Arthroderma sp. PD_2]|nr:hypothetical protein FQN49_001656 [Arthroderma sp. PD_2]
MGTAPGQQEPAMGEKIPNDLPAYRESIDEAAGGPEKVSTDHTHRKLKPRHIQLIGIGGTVGTALFVQIGKGLLSGGPASLFIAFSWCSMEIFDLTTINSLVQLLPLVLPALLMGQSYWRAPFVSPFIYDHF